MPASPQGVATAPFGVSEFTTWPLTFEEDLALYQECGVDAIELCEFKLADGAPGEDQLRQLKDSGLLLASVQPRLHSLFPDAPRPEPVAPRERMAQVEGTMRRIGKHFPGGRTLVSITGAAPRADFAAAYRTAVEEYGRMARVAADCGCAAGGRAAQPDFDERRHVSSARCGRPAGSSTKSTTPAFWVVRGCLARLGGRRRARADQAIRARRFSASTSTIGKPPRVRRPPSARRRRDPARSAVASDSRLGLRGGLHPGNFLGRPPRRVTLE